MELVTKLNMHSSMFFCLKQANDKCDWLAATYIVFFSIQKIVKFKCFENKF